MDRQTSDLLQKDNPWIGKRDALLPWLQDHIPSNHLKRHQLAEAQKRWGEQNKAHLLIGPRQAGKSTAIWQWLCTREKEVLFIDCEQTLIQDWCSSAPLFISDIKENFPTAPILFFEEVQHLKEASLFFKGIVDRKPGTPILVSGSSSYSLQSQTRESLAGRATRARLLPFSYGEIACELESTAPLARTQKQEELFTRHLLYGGYPDVWLSEQPQIILTDLLESFLIRDASDLHRIKRPDAFRTLLSLSAQQAGSLVNVSEWAQILGLSRDSVYAYLEILQSMHIIELIRPFAGGKRSELIRSPKVFWLDNGLRNRLLADFRPPELRQDMGSLLENWVFGEVVKHLPSLAQIFFWRSTSGAEVDFVVRYGEKLIAIEVKSSRSPKKQITRSMHSFIDAYEPESFGLVHPGLHDREMIANTNIQWIPPREIGPWVKHCLSRDNFK
ncbi:MAG: ATP-binding protein [Deltaproteobacteria bacterium]|nr:ATP-binding protein [Deltaproteobacteria bacterium]